VTGRHGSHGDGFEVIVGTNGSLSVPTDELARHGVRPDAHLRLVQVPQPRTPRRRMRGALAESVDAEALDAFEAVLATRNPSTSLLPSNLVLSFRGMLA
jgi:hypothetical protein